LEIGGVSSLDMADSLFYERLDIYMKIFLIVYADDTLSFSESLDEMQSMLGTDHLTCREELWFFFSFRMFYFGTTQELKCCFPKKNILIPNVAEQIF
jgi:hypothetical protein